MRIEVSNIFKEWKVEAGIGGTIFLVISNSGTTIKVFTDNPRWMIGHDGFLLDKYKKKLKEYNHNLEHIKVEEPDTLYIRIIFELYKEKLWII